MWQRRGGDLAVTEIGGDRCLMESRITELPGFTYNHQLLRFPLFFSPSSGSVTGSGAGGGGDGDFQISS